MDGIIDSDLRPLTNCRVPSRLYLFRKRRFIYVRDTSLLPVLRREAIDNSLESLLCTNR